MLGLSGWSSKIHVKSASRSPDTEFAQRGRVGAKKSSSRLIMAKVLAQKQNKTKICFSLL